MFIYKLTFLTTALYESPTLLNMSNVPKYNVKTFFYSGQKQRRLAPRVFIVALFGQMLVRYIKIPCKTELIDGHI